MFSIAEHFLFHSTLEPNTEVFSKVSLPVTGIVQGAIAPFPAFLSSRHETGPEPPRRLALTKGKRHMPGRFKTAPPRRIVDGFHFFHATQRLRAKKETSDSGSHGPSEASSLI